MGITIGITELRQHARRYLDRVRAGETVTVTDRGEPVAELRPLPRPEGALARVIERYKGTPEATAATTDKEDVDKALTGGVAPPAEEKKPEAEPK